MPKFEDSITKFKGKMFTVPTKTSGFHGMDEISAWFKKYSGKIIQVKKDENYVKLCGRPATEWPLFGETLDPSECRKLTPAEIIKLRLSHNGKTKSKR